MNWKRKVVRVTQRSTKTEMKLPEAMTTREGTDRAESQAAQM